MHSLLSVVSLKSMCATGHFYFHYSGVLALLYKACSQKTQMWYTAKQHTNVQFNNTATIQSKLLLCVV